MGHLHLSRQIAVVTIAAFLLGACAGAPVAPTPTLRSPLPTVTLASIPPTPPAPQYEDLIRLFDYDPQAPLDFVETDVRNQDDVGIH